MCYNINSFWNFHGQQNIVCENIGLLNAARSGASSVQTIASRAWPVVRRILTGRERGGQRTASRGRTALYFPYVSVHGSFGRQSASGPANPGLLLPATRGVILAAFLHSAQGRRRGRGFCFPRLGSGAALHAGAERRA